MLLLRSAFRVIDATDLDRVFGRGGDEDFDETPTDETPLDVDYGSREPFEGVEPSFDTDIGPSFNGDLATDTVGHDYAFAGPPADVVSGSNYAASEAPRGDVGPIDGFPDIQQFEPYADGQSNELEPPWPTSDAWAGVEGAPLVPNLNSFAPPQVTTPTAFISLLSENPGTGDLNEILHTRNVQQSIDDPFEFGIPELDAFASPTRAGALPPEIAPNMDGWLFEVRTPGSGANGPGWVPRDSPEYIPELNGLTSDTHLFPSPEARAPGGVPVHAPAASDFVSAQPVKGGILGGDVYLNPAAAPAVSWGRTLGGGAIGLGATIGLDLAQPLVDRGMETVRHYSPEIADALTEQGHAINTGFAVAAPVMYGVSRGAEWMGMNHEAALAVGFGADMLARAVFLPYTPIAAAAGLVTYGIQSDLDLHARHHF